MHVRFALVVALLATPALAAEPDGQALYKKHCSSCHGLDGHPAAMFLKLKVPAFADATWQKSKTDDELREVVEKGVKGTTMQSFRSRLKPEEIEAVIDHVRTMAAADDSKR